MRLEFEMEEKRTIERLEKQHQEAMELLREQHALTIADVKKKQWVSISVNLSLCA